VRLFSLPFREGRGGSSPSFIGMAREAFLGRLFSLPFREGRGGSSPSLLGRVGEGHLPPF